jgi:hypothetical protein
MTKQAIEFHNYSPLAEDAPKADVKKKSLSKNCSLLSPVFHGVRGAGTSERTSGPSSQTSWLRRGTTGAVKLNLGNDPEGKRAPGESATAGGSAGGGSHIRRGF